MCVPACAHSCLPVHVHLHMHLIELHQEHTCSCMRAMDSEMRTTASSWRTVMGTTCLPLSFYCWACILSEFQSELS